MMKKVEQVEVEYVKKTTVLIVGVVCLAVGFFLGIIYSNLTPGSSGKVRKISVNQQAPVNPRANRILALEQEVSANPKNADAWAQLGHAYFDINEFKNAIRAYKKHLELKPGNADVWTDMGVMYRRSKQPKEAIRCFDRAIEINPRHQTARFNKGIVLMFDLQDREAALKSWEELLKINPSAAAPDGQSIKDLIEKYRSEAQK